MAKSTKQLLKERGETNGDFREHARITQELKGIISTGVTYHELTDSQKESLQMILHKIGRILAGNPNHKDHWDDIAGYATLISQQLED